MVSRMTAVGVEMEDNGWPRETSEDGAGGSDGDGAGADSRWLGSWADGGPGLELGVPGRSRFEPEDREFNSAHFIFVAPRGGRHPGKRLES